MKDYQIIKCTYIDDVGKKYKSYYQVKWLQPTWFFGLWNYWKYATRGYYDGDEIIKFSTPKEARWHIDNVLCTGLKTESTHRELVDNVNCDEYA